MKWGGLLLSLALLLPFPSQAGDREEANKLFVQAARLVRQANAVESSAEAERLYSKALGFLDTIEVKYPGTDLAVKIISNQNIGSINRKEIEELRAAKALLAETETALKPPPKKEDAPPFEFVKVQPSEPLVTNEAEPLPFDESQEGKLIATRDIAALSPKWSSTPYYFSAKLGGSRVHIGDIKETAEYRGDNFVERAGSIHPSDRQGDVKKKASGHSILMGGVAAGYNWEGQGLPVRTEIEYAFRDNFGYGSTPTYLKREGMPSGDYSWKHDSDLDIHTLMVNAFYDYDTGTKFTPYAGGGAGLSLNITDTVATMSDDVGTYWSMSPNADAGLTQESTGKAYNFAKSLMAGVTYDLTDRWLIDMGYRYIDFGEVYWRGMFGHPVESQDVKANEIFLGVRFQH
jgi:opacity protein-like surface antigen